MRLRLAAIWLVLFAVYASTLGLDSFGSSEYGGDEPHYLLTAKSLVDDGDFDVRNQRAEREWDEFYPYFLDRPREAHRRPRARAARRRLPHSDRARVTRSAGAKAVELFLAAIAALGGVLAYLLALRVVPDPWAIGATLAVDAVAAVHRVRQRRVSRARRGARRSPARRCSRCGSRSGSRAPRCGGLLPAARHASVARHEVRAGGHRDRRRSPFRTLWRARQRTLALLTAELALFSVIFYVTLNEALYDGPTPVLGRLRGRDRDRRELPRRVRRAHLPAGRALHRPRVRAAALGARVPARGRRRVDARAHAPARSSRARCRSTRAPRRPRSSCALALGAQLIVAAFLAPTMFGFWFPARHLLAGLLLAVPLVAWGMRRLPKTGAVLAALSGASLGLALRRRALGRRRAGGGST